MGQTMAEKIVSRQAGREVYANDKLEHLPITKLFFNDVIGPPAIKGFQEDFTDVFEKCGKPPQVFDPKRIFFTPDHSVPTFDKGDLMVVDPQSDFFRYLKDPKGRGQ
jgi:homoaconitase/3-isopropylmalate dehydratase large subunit